MEIKKSLYINLYLCNVEFIVTDDIEQYSDELVSGLVLNDDLSNYKIVVALQNLTYNTINHEIYHCVSRIGNERGIDDEESLAWLMGFISDNFFKFVNSKKYKIGYGWFSKYK